MVKKYGSEMDPLRILLSIDKKNLVFTSNFFLKRQSTTITSTTVWISTTSTFFFSRKKIQQRFWKEDRARQSSKPAIHI